MKISKKMLSLYGVIVLLIFTLYNSLEMNILFYIAVFLMVLGLFLRLEDVFLVYSMWIPNLMMIKPLESSMALMGYFLLMLVLKEFVIQKRMNCTKQDIQIIFVHCICVGMTYVVTRNMTLVMGLLRLLAFVFLICFLSKKKDREWLFKDVIEYYVLGCALNVLLGFLFCILTELDIFSGAYASIRNDRNYFAIMLASGLHAGLAESYVSKKMDYKRVILLLVIACGGILSNSRTFILLAIPCFLWIFCLLKKVRKSKGFYLGVGSIFAVGGYLFGKLFIDSLSDVLERFNQKDVTSGNGRFDAWEYYIGEVSDSVVTFFFGAGNSTNYVEKGLITVVEHNTLVQTFFSMGFIGVVSMCLVYYLLYKKIRTLSQQPKLLLFIPLIAVLAGYMTINGMYADNFTFALFVCFIVLSLEDNEKIKV